MEEKKYLKPFEFETEPEPDVIDPVIHDRMQGEEYIRRVETGVVIENVRQSVRDMRYMS